MIDGFSARNNKELVYADSQEIGVNCTYRLGEGCASPVPHYDE
jgi:hypothetical protein